MEPSVPIRTSYHKPLLIAGLLSLSGCVTTQTDDNLDRAKQETNAYTQWDIEQSQGQQVSYLTDLITDPNLDRLISQALKANPDLHRTILALQITKAQRRVTDADKLPSVSLDIDADSESDDGDSYGSSLDVSWELDLWDKLGDSSSAARLDVDASAINLQSARDSLAANVMRSYLSLARYQQLIEIETQRVALLTSNEAIIMQRYRSGLGDLEELDDARSSSASSRSSLVGYQQNLRTEQRTLSLLLGQKNTELTLPKLDAFPEVITPLAQLPEQDLGRRPDLKQAYAEIEAQQYRTQVAYKALLPSISLSASVSIDGDTPRDALIASPVWALLGSLTAPLFQGGQLRALAKVEELTTEQLYWTYQESLLNAVSEVEDALDQEQSLARQQQHLTEALASSQRSAANYKDKYRQGLVDMLDLLTVQQQSFDQQVNLVQTIYNRLANRVDLGLALGLGVSS
jgi:NodT family efflux transporter outer membrane factor (OMF) lipoprotein